MDMLDQHETDAPAAPDVEPLGNQSDLAADIRAAYDEVDQRHRAERGEITDDVFAPLEDELKSSGMSKRDAVQRLINAEQILRRDPGTGLSVLAKAYVKNEHDLARVVHHLSQSVGYAPSADAVARAHAQISHDHQQAAVQAASAEIDAFGASRDGAGNARYPRFSDQAVRRSMGEAIMAATERGEHMTMAQAYAQVTATTAPKAKAGKPAPFGGVEDATEDLRAEFRRRGL
jgi:hypothetical protein